LGWAILAGLLTATGSASAASVRVAVVQLSSSDAGNYARMSADARSAKQAGAEIVVFPEASDLGWLNPAAFSDAAEIPGATSDRFADIARATGLWVVAGLTERGKRASASPPTFEAYDDAVLIDPSGAIILRHRQHNVVRNAFSSCPARLGTGCGYTPGSLEDTAAVRTPFGLVGLAVCDDAFTSDIASLDALKRLGPDLVIVPWGITAGTQEECGKSGFDATGFAAQAATYLRATVVGANATGPRTFGRLLPSWYCGTSGYATSTGGVGGVMDAITEVGVFDVPTAR
jgi:predicted amidohydrolase